MKIVIGEKGKSYSVELPKEKEPVIYGTKIGDSLEGNLIGAAGYKFTVRGGSDKDGFPMKADVATTMKRRVILRGRPCYRPKRAGEVVRRFVRGNTISAEISQLNIIVTEAGPMPLDQLFPQAEKKEKKEEAPKAAGGKKKK